MKKTVDNKYLEYSKSPKNKTKNPKNTLKIPHTKIGCHMTNLKKIYPLQLLE